METKKLWIIPGDKLEHLEDGKPVFYDFSDHQESCSDFCKKYNINNDSCTSHLAYAKLFTSLGMALVFNSGQKMDGYYFCGIYLPEELSEKQIEFFENSKEMFQEKYYSKAGFFTAKVASSVPLTYNTNDGFRDLTIESIIENRTNDNGQELLYIEVERQKEFLKQLKM